jgi:anti-sigma regulatory factor (Ser/Thr protein kinase)
VTSLNARVDLPPTVSAPRTARQIVAALLTGWGVQARTEDVVLLVNEVISNAVEHVGGDTSLELELTYSDKWLRVSLADGSTERPVPRDIDPRSPRGRGLHLVDAIADRWDSEQYRDGKRVWFELDI